MFLAACLGNVISLGLRDSATDSEDVSFLRGVLYQMARTCSPQGVLLTGM